MKSLLIVSAFFFASLSLFSQPSLFIALEKSLGFTVPIVGSKILVASDGDYILTLQVKISAPEADQATIMTRINSDGTIEWCRASSLHYYKGSSAQTQTPQGEILTSGFASIGQEATNPEMTVFTPDGRPIRNICFSLPGYIHDIAFISDNQMVTAGRKLDVDMSEAIIGNHFLSSMNAEGELLWIKEIPFSIESLVPFTSFHLVSCNGNILVTGEATIEGCCLDQPFTLISMSGDGTTMQSELLFPDKSGFTEKEEADRYISTSIEGIQSIEGRTVIYGSLTEAIVDEENDPEMMPKDFTVRQYGLVICLNDHQQIIWSKKIAGFASLPSTWRGTLHNDGSIILIATDSSSSETLVHLDSEGRLQQAYRIVKSPAYSPDNPDSKPDKTDAFHMLSLTTTRMGKVAALCLTMESKQNTTYPHVSLLVFDPHTVPPCLDIKPLDIKVEPVEFTREPLEIKLSDIPNVQLSSVKTHTGIHAPSIRNLCPE